MTSAALGVRRSGVQDLPAPLREAWAAARVRAAHTAPYLTTAVLALQPVVVDGLEEAGCSAAALRAFPVDTGWRVHLDPHWLAVTPPAGIAFWLVHQVGHLLRQHADRFGAACPQPAAVPGQPRTPEQQRWNVSADCEVNDDVPGDARASDAVLPSSLGLADGQPAEVYWAALAHRTPTSVQATVDCGSGTDGVARGWDSGEPGLTEPEARQVRRETARTVAARGREGGDVPEAWRRWAEQVLEPVVDWRRELSAALRLGVAGVVGRVDYSYVRPSRRAGAVPGVVLPSLRQPVPQVTVLLDTSQSMLGEPLSRAVAEVGGVLRAVGVARHSLRVLCCDSTAYDSARVLDAREVQVVGGGGTDLRAGLAAAASARPRPDLVVVLTDGGTDWPQERPRHGAVVVGLLDSRRRPPDWARTVDIPWGGA